jgi:hypothetical protein
VCLTRFSTAAQTDFRFTVAEDDDLSNVNGSDSGQQKSDEDEDIDEVIGYHFMECTSLFVAYIYVNSGEYYDFDCCRFWSLISVLFKLAAKVFEDRLVNKGLTAEFPDFEAVYHLVIEAVDNYNELWEDAYREQHRQQNPPDDKKPASARNESSNNNGSQIETRRMAFMTEKEKKEELILRQRAELAIKKGTAELDQEMEKQIGIEVLALLESELNKLLAEESEENIHATLPISRKNNSTSMDSRPYNESKSESSGGNVNKLGRQTATVTKDKAVVANPGVINIDDLFDLAIDTPGYLPLLDDSTPTTEEVEGPSVGGSNEFAAELLYIMKTSISLS